MDDAMARHVAEIERLNQRGGRMLSIVDLIEVGTVTRDLAAYLLAAIGTGASFMTAALPGGAGKTTVMGALLNFVPEGRDLVAADGAAAIAGGLDRPRPPRCFVCHEIGAGRYDAYLWNGLLRAWFELGRAGHQLATNLHADSIEGARRQVCVDNAVPAADFHRMHLVLFIRWDGADRREIREVWESDGTSAHRRIASEGRVETSAARLANAADVGKAAATLDAVLRSGAREVGDVRRVLLDHRGDAGGGRPAVP